MRTYWRKALVAYRFEIWLVLGSSLAMSLVTTMSYQVVSSLRLLVTISDWVLPAVALLVLAAPYPWVLRQGREFLKVLWTLMIALTVLDIGWPAVDAVVHDDEPGTSMWVVTGVGRWLLVAGLSLFFARRATRLSVSHAFLLLLLPYGGFVLALPWSGHWSWFELRTATQIAYAASMGIGVLGAAVAFWVLIRIDTSTKAFRVKMVVALLALFWSGIVAGVGMEAAFNAGLWFGQEGGYDSFFITSRLTIETLVFLLETALLFPIIWLIRGHRRELELSPTLHNYRSSRS